MRRAWVPVFALLVSGFVVVIAKRRRPHPAVGVGSAFAFDHPRPDIPPGHVVRQPPTKTFDQVAGTSPTRIGIPVPPAVDRSHWAVEATRRSADFARESAAIFAGKSPLEIILFVVQSVVMLVLLSALALALAVLAIGVWQDITGLFSIRWLP